VLQISWGLRNKHFGILQSYEGYVVKRRLLVQPMAVLNRWCCYSLAAISGSASRLQRILRRQPMGDSPFLVLVAAAAAAAAVVVVVVVVVVVTVSLSDTAVVKSTCRGRHQPPQKLRQQGTFIVLC